MKPHILRVENVVSGGTVRWWAISDGAATREAPRWYSLRAALAHWETAHGRPPHGYQRVAGVHTPEQLSAFVANLRRQLPKSCRACGCTDDDCRQCVEATGHACSWVEGEDPPICSRCAAEEDAALLAAMEREGGGA